MLCENCGLEMIIYRVEQKEDGSRETVYACRNPQCPRFDKRLKKPEK
ncbi:MAG: hypothetical protein SO072_02615 [Dysosmobacter sp.]|nr:hypothetical protein [Dysosmobacter sp.]